jgi:hypothetical protein
VSGFWCSLAPVGIQYRGPGFLAADSQELVQGAAVASIWLGERLRKKAWIWRSRPGRLTTVLATAQLHWLNPWRTR